MKTLKITSLLFMLVGCIHLAVTPMVSQQYNSLELHLYLVFLYMFVMMGLAMIFVAWLQYKLSKNQINSKNTKVLITGSIIFMTITGLGAVGTMWTNPFAYIGLTLALIQLLSLKKIGKL